MPLYTPGSGWTPQQPNKQPANNSSEAGQPRPLNRPQEAQPRPQQIEPRPLNKIDQVVYLQPINRPQEAVNQPEPIVIPDGAIPIEPPKTTEPEPQRAEQSQSNRIPNIKVEIKVPNKDQEVKIIPLPKDAFQQGPIIQVPPPQENRGMPIWPFIGLAGAVALFIATR
jgi:hypothetical protein